MHEGFFHRLAAPPALAHLSMAGNSPGAGDLATHIRRVAEAQDRRAFAALFEHFAPRVKSYMLRLGATAAQAEDLAQETLLTLWRKAGTFDPARAGAATWVFTIARNLRIDAIRRERLIEPGEPPEDAEAPDPRADTVMESDQAERGLRAAIAGLPEEQAMLLRMSFFEDYAHGDISARLGMPLGTVKSKLRRAILRLREVLEDFA